MAVLTNQYPQTFTYFIAVQSFTYCIVILLIIGYTIYNARKEKIDCRLLSMSLFLYTLLFFICVIYAVFRCSLGFDFESFKNPQLFCNATYIASISLYGLSKLVMYSLFLYRLHIVSMGTLFGFKEFLLLKIAVIICIMTLILIPLWIYTVFPSIHYFVTNNVAICALDLTKESNMRSIILLMIGIADNIVALSILGLWVFKLSQIIAASSYNDNSGNTRHSLTNDLTKLLRKQTILVAIALLSSCLVFYITQIFSYRWTVLAVPLDCVINAITTFLTFKWYNNIWQCCCVKVLCCNFCQCLPCCHDCDTMTLELAISVSNFSEQRSIAINGKTTDNVVGNEQNDERMDVIDEDKENEQYNESKECIQLVPIIKTKSSGYSIMDDNDNKKEDVMDLDDYITPNGSSKSHGSGSRFNFGNGLKKISDGDVSSTVDTPLMSDNDITQRNRTLTVLSNADESILINQMNLELSDANNEEFQSLGSIQSPLSNESVRL